MWQKLSIGWRGEFICKRIPLQRPRVSTCRQNREVSRVGSRRNAVNLEIFRTFWVGLVILSWPVHTPLLFILATYLFSVFLSLGFSSVHYFCFIYSNNNDAILSYNYYHVFSCLYCFIVSLLHFFCLYKCFR